MRETLLALLALFFGLDLFVRLLQLVEQIIRQRAMRAFHRRIEEANKRAAETLMKNVERIVREHGATGAGALGIRIDGERPN